MGTLSEIEAAADALPPAQQQELLLFLAARLRAQRREVSPPRRFPREQVDAWIAEDEAAMRRLRSGQDS